MADKLDDVCDTRSAACRGLHQLRRVYGITNSSTCASYTGRPFCSSAATKPYSFVPPGVVLCSWCCSLLTPDLHFSRKFPRCCMATNCQMCVIYRVQLSGSDMRLSGWFSVYVSCRIIEHVVHSPVSQGCLSQVYGAATFRISVSQGWSRLASTVSLYQLYPAGGSCGKLTVLISLEHPLWNGNAESVHDSLFTAGFHSVVSTIRNLGILLPYSCCAA